MLRLYRIITSYGHYLIAEVFEIRRVTLKNNSERSNRSKKVPAVKSMISWKPIMREEPLIRQRRGLKNHEKLVVIVRDGGG